MNVSKLARGGFDPPTFGLWAQHAASAPSCSTLCRHPGSNQRPQDLQSCALPTEL